jgi:putative transposase
MFLTYRYRIKDGSSSTRRALRAQARSVNFVWNYCCQIDREAYDRYKAGRCIRRPTHFDLQNLCRGVTKELGIHSDTIDAICSKFTNARDACFPKTPRFRSFKKNLDFIPFSNFKRPAKIDVRGITVMKRTYHLWQSRPLPENGKPKSWEFSTDSRGRWYINIQIELPDTEKKVIKTNVGVDLGLKTLATLSDGTKVETPAFYRKSQEQIAIFQRRGQKVRVRSLSAKIANQRRHFLHEASTRLVLAYDRIVVGDVSSSKLIKTRMAKSVHDAGWTMLKNFLSYKLIAAGGSFEIVSEYMTSQTCSECGCLPLSRPRGIAGLGIRHFDCSDCGASLDRDINAARNILRVGAERRPPVVGISPI